MNYLNKKIPQMRDCNDLFYFNFKNTVFGLQQYPLLQKDHFFCFREIITLKYIKICAA